MLGNGETEARILPEGLVRPGGGEALENLLDRFGGDAGPVVVDGDLDLVLQSPASDAHRAAGGRKRAGIVDQVVDHLPEPGIVPEHAEGGGSAAFEVQGDGDAIVMALIGHADDGREK